MLRVSEHSVRQNIRKYAETSTTAEGFHTGRLCKTIWHDNLLLKKDALRNRTSTLRKLYNKLACVSGTQVSANAVSCRLAENGIRRLVAKPKPWLSDRHRRAGLQWTKTTPTLGSDWDEVLWTDESRFTLFDSSRRRAYVSIRKGEDYRPERHRPTVKLGGKSVMVSGCFALNLVGELRQTCGIMNGRSYLQLVRDAGRPMS